MKYIPTDNEVVMFQSGPCDDARRGDVLHPRRSQVVLQGELGTLEMSLPPASRR
jgi:hypothetical protein